ncbi:helix-turn-helix transcriptional regulator [Hyphomicrobium sp. DMF-1]|uniref:helix-turn-helix transcriptional regulator n=1 Tax=Hyphomicrobium sp. DMF-1 TaxID=3019544 RepID=UPI0022EBB0E9|nr:helix-turn-helix domain-containing protein [Hyphomicrobium sp. DMF-1]WBT37821.1 helix-turn-helix domain-containing protein [Hyphomicrobium sp. DMF-1]
MKNRTRTLLIAKRSRKPTTNPTSTSRNSSHDPRSTGCRASPTRSSRNSVEPSPWRSDPEAVSDGHLAGGHLLTTSEAARYLRLSPRTLEGFRVRGSGPRFMKLGSGLRSRVLYHPADIRAWLERRFSSTSEYGM